MGAPSLRLCLCLTLLLAGVNLAAASFRQTRYILSNWNGRKPAKYHSQFGEDLLVETLFFKHVVGGFFVELGGFDGKTFSNSLYLEKAKKWKGVLLEGHPKNFRQLVKNRPGAVCINRAICDNPQGTVEFVGDGSLVSGARETMSESYMKKFHSTIEKEATVTVKCGPIGKFLGDLGVPRIDFFSIDVEGAEHEVLSTMDWNIPVRVLVIEMDGSDAKKDKANHEFLLGKGFKTVKNWKLKNTGIYLNTTYAPVTADIQQKDTAAVFSRFNELQQELSG